MLENELAGAFCRNLGDNLEPALRRGRIIVLGMLEFQGVVAI